MTNEELERLEALANAATPGPWEWRREHLEYGPWRMRSGDVVVFDDGTAWEEYASPMDNEAGDAAFIAAARDAVPALVAEVRRLRVLVETEYSRVHGQIHTTSGVAIQQASLWAAAEASFDSDARRVMDGAK